MKNIFRKYIIIFSFLLSFHVYSQEYIYYNVTNNKNLYSNFISSLAQAGNGSLMIGTTAGLYYYCGNDFLYENYTKLQNKPIYSLYYSSDNSIYVGTSEGFAVIDENNRKKYFTDFEGNYFVPFSFYENIDRILLATNVGVLAFKNDSLYLPADFSQLKGKRCYAVIYSNGYFYVASKQGLFAKRSSSDKWEQLLNFKVMGLEKGNDDKVWVSTEKGLYYITAYNLALVNKKITTESRYSVLTYFKQNNTFLIPQIDYVSEVKDGEIINRYSCPINADGPILIDRDSNVWLGGLTQGGLVRSLSFNVKRFYRAEGIKATPFGIIQRSNGEIIVATDGQGLLKYEGGNFIQYIEGLPSQLGVIYEDSQKRLWVGNNGDGVGLFYITNNKDIVNLKRTDGKPWNIVTGFYEDNEGVIWILSVKEILSFDGQKFRTYEINLTKSQNSYVYGMFSPGKEQYMIIGTFGLAKFDRKTGKTTLIEPRKFYKEGLSITQVAKLHDGKYALGTDNTGVIIYNPNAKDSAETFFTLNESNGLISNYVYNILIDNNNYLWIGTNTGLSILNYNLFSKEGKIKFINFGLDDPVLGNEYNQFSCLNDDKNRVWLGGTFGIVLFEKPEKFVSQFRTLKPIVKSAEIFLEDGKTKKLSISNFMQRLTLNNLKYNENTILLNFDAISFTNRNLMKYSYSLASDDGSVVRNFGWTKLNNIYFVNLAPNQYHVNLKVKDQFGNVKFVERAISFFIPNPFWKTKIFYSLLIFTFTLILLLAIIIRESSLKKRNVELRKLLEDKKHLAEELEKSKNEYQTLFENAFNPMIIIDFTNSKILDANNAACALFGYTLKEIREIDFERIFAASKKEFEKHYKNFKKTGVSYTHLELKLKKKNGEEIDAEISGKLIRYKGVDAAILVIKDITAEKIAERNFQLSVEKLKKTEKMKANFLAQMSHEIRTPLSSITSYITLLKDELSGGISEELDFAITTIVKSSRRIIRTVELMLNKSELDANLYEINKENFDLIELLHLIIAEYREMAEFQGIALNLFYDKKHVIVYGDYYSYKAIFSNLIDNAIKYTSEGEVKVKVNSTGKDIIVEIIDTGIGIKKEYLPYLFTAFSQEEEGYTRKFDGNGLGLAVVKSFCDLNKCRIEVESEKGKGSTFRVIIPKES